MVRFRLVSALAVVALVAALFLVPAVADAEPRLDRGGGDRWEPPWEKVRDWIVNTWGAGGPGMDPGGNKGTGNLTPDDPPTRDRETPTPERDSCGTE